MTCILSCHWSLCVYLPFSGERLNPPPQMFIRGGGVWVGCLVLGGWVPQNPKTPQPLINIPCSSFSSTRFCWFRIFDTLITSALWLVKQQAQKLAHSFTLFVCAFDKVCKLPDGPTK